MRFSSYATIVSSASLAFAVPAKRQASSTAAGGPVTPSPVPAPAGGIGFNSTPTYKPMSDFDFQSLNLGLHQELIELDLFHYGLAQFSSQDFEDAGLTPSDQYLIEFMADQEVGHATIFENFLAPNLTQQCTYSYPNFTSVRDWIDFSMKVTRFGESGTFGFLAHLNAQDIASMIFDAIATEARQQMVFRQFEGLFPMPFWFIPSITQSMQWTLMQPYISSCPAGNPNVTWPIFPPLNILNNPYYPDLNLTADISSNVTAVTYPGRVVKLTWEEPGAVTGFNKSFTTQSSAGTAKYAAWISQLNTTYTLLEDVNGTSASTIQPSGALFNNVTLFSNSTFPLLNGTVYLLITDAAPLVTPYNLSQIEPHIVAGPALYQVG
ncbi:Rds1 protein [Stereum hirsutum FP-91666 SS1]|uniref:Rds1 protein n=1 Tax=Stereum hirsutum (strain FP-91666) TaxID=721885 RepID=UPI000440AB46|nr:Rds1 protein [Stereum hirsutum FP-91666 SS1]EIM92371.1 Rds1 protein [Stereum hirsutum FP-91666 SS1]